MGKCIRVTSPAPSKNALNDAGVVLNESQAADQLEKYRSYVFYATFDNAPYLTFDRENESFKGLSFPTISATGPNGGMFLTSAFLHLHLTHGSFSAIIHYQPERDDCAIVRKDQVRIHLHSPFGDQLIPTLR